MKRFLLAATLAALSLTTAASEADYAPLERDCVAAGGVFNLTRQDHLVKVNCDARDMHAQATITMTETGGLRIEGVAIGDKDFSLPKFARQVEGTCIRLKGKLTQDGSQHMQLRLSCLVDEGRLSVEARQVGGHSSLLLTFVPLLQVNREVMGHE